MTMMTGKDIEKAAELLLRAWGDPGERLSSLPEALRLGNLAHAYGIQEAVSRAFFDRRMVDLPTILD